MTGRNDQHPEEQRGIKLIDFKLSLSVRPGALAAIRIARRSYITRPDPWPSRVDENRCIGDGSPCFSSDAPPQIGPRRTEGVDCPKAGNQ